MHYLSLSNQAAPVRLKRVGMRHARRRPAGRRRLIVRSLDAADLLLTEGCRVHASHGYRTASGLWPRARIGSGLASFTYAVCNPMWEEAQNKSNHVRHIAETEGSRAR